MRVGVGAEAWLSLVLSKVGGRAGARWASLHRPPQGTQMVPPQQWRGPFLLGMIWNCSSSTQARAGRS